MSLYDEDILVWSEQQAAIIRALARSRRDLPNAFDPENVAEEIESVGRSELAAVRSYVELILVHAIKLALDPSCDAARHWRREIFAFGRGLDRRFAPSMQSRVDLEDAWQAAREIARFDDLDPTMLQNRCPFVLEDLLGGRLDGTALAGKLRSPEGPGAPVGP